MVKNKYKANSRLWKKFKTETARQVFNDVMEQSLKNISITIHPDTDEDNLPKNQWETICHNFACYAAFAVSKNRLDKGDVVIDVDKNDKEVKRRKVA